MPLFLGGERVKTGPELKLIITSITHHILRTVYHMIMIFRYMWAINSTKWTILVCHASYLMNHTLYDCYLWYICVKWSLGFFFILSKFSLMCSISQEPYIILLSVVIYKCKMMIPPGVFSIFSKFWFLRLLVGKRAKRPKMTRNSVCCAPYLRNIILYDYHLCYTSIKWWYLLVLLFLFFSKFWFFSLLVG